MSQSWLFFNSEDIKDPYRKSRKHVQLLRILPTNWTTNILWSLRRIKRRPCLRQQGPLVYRRANVTFTIKMSDYWYHIMIWFISCKEQKLTNIIMQLRIIKYFEEKDYNAWRFFASKVYKCFTVYSYIHGLLFVSDTYVIYFSSAEVVFIFKTLI